MPTIACINFEDIKPSDIIIVYIALTKSFYSVLTTRQSFRRYWFREKHNTPGCDVPMTPDADGLGFTAAWLKKVTRNIILTGIIYLCRVLHTKGTVRHVTFIMTMWTEEEEGRGKQREEQLLRNFWKLVFRVKSGLMCFEGTVESAWNITRVVTTEARGRLQREHVDHRLLNLISGFMQKPKPVFTLEQVTSSRSTVHISDSPITMTNTASITESRDVSSSDHPNYSEGSAPAPEHGHPFVPSASHERLRQNFFDSSVTVNINSSATASVITSGSFLYSIQANISCSTDELTVAGNSSLQLRQLANQLSDCIRNLDQAITEVRHFNPPQVNINEGNIYCSLIYNSGGFVGGRNNFNNLKNGGFHRLCCNSS
ncbi:hypothetical protein BDN71DRAFT_1428696 [Pleurotus eryngii]|uniref:Uncharacterized protein n=1 Tax=Pleurotus eryngii TaxID=5323 RepID=A0A9P6A3U5_PLEER|nr:hypothetical protein BDN71DRAFT_1428696 [Pleurotus eryngii]